MINLYPKNKGQTIVEMMLVVLIVSMLVTGVSVASISSSKNTSSSKLKNESLRMAQDGLEAARQLRDQGWDPFSQMANNSYCYNQTTDIWLSSASHCLVAGSTVFSRLVQFGSISDNTIIITSSVTWIDGISHETKLQTLLSDWK